MSDKKSTPSSTSSLTRSTTYLQEQLIPYKLSFRLKEKDFDEICLGMYLGTGHFQFYLKDQVTPVLHNTHNLVSGDRCTAPLYTQVIDWFIEKHQIYIWANPLGMGYVNAPHVKWEWFLDDSNALSLHKAGFGFRNLALHKAIEEALNIIN